mmetsp:Transcript_48629/g.150661  ORF Transcript_48629/g.150661 Transcript_48629/m.150661 type:complete len:585 (-) Transcript_48629:27-1781(-)
MAPPETPVATCLWALAALLPEAKDRAPHQALVEAAAEMDPEEAAAVREFEAAAWKCCGRLGKDALFAVRAAAKAISAGDDTKEENDSAQCLVGQNSVLQMFEQFDANGDGQLTKDQFKEMLVTLGLKEHFSEAEIASLVGAADTNSDGSVDLHEFTDWLYTGAEGVAGVQDKEVDGVKERRRSEDRRAGDENLKLQQARSAFEAVQKELTDAKRSHDTAMRRAEQHFEEEHETSLQFWRAVAEASATDRLGQVLEMDTATLLGNGKYGYILKSKRRSDGVVAVVKLLSLRWAHVAATEWGKAKAAADHPNIVEYADVMLHADDDKVIHGILMAAQDEGRLQTRVRRGTFPRCYVCLMQEFMNAGTVQDWMERNLLLPGGLLVTMQKVACALAHMHQLGLTHNDVKPENVLLSQADESNSRSEVTVKLADLGLAARSTDRTDDFWQYGMTVFCMAMGEKFGERKYQPGLHAVYVEAVSMCVPHGDGVMAALGKLPWLLRKVFSKEMTMQEISEADFLQGWCFFDGEVGEDETSNAKPLGSPTSACRNKRFCEGRVQDVRVISARRTLSVIMDEVEAEAEAPDASA